MDLACLLHGAPPWEKAFHLRQSVGRREAASRLIRRQLEDDHPEAPVEELLLELSGLGEGAGEQASLFPDVREGRERRLAEVERQLRGERLGGGPALYRMESIAPWHPAPEMRVLQVPLDPSGGDTIRLTLSLARLTAPSRNIRLPSSCVLDYPIVDGPVRLDAPEVQGQGVSGWRER